MNFLAHFLLSGDDHDLLLGNLLGDIVKGRVERYVHAGTTERIRDGIRCFTQDMRLDGSIPGRLASTAD